MKNNPESPLLLDPVSPALLATLRRSLLQDSEKEFLVKALRELFERVATWDNLVERPKGQNYNPQACRLCQIYLDSAQVKNIGLAAQILSLCLPDLPEAEEYLKSLQFNPPPHFHSFWEFAQPETEASASTHSFVDAEKEALAVFFLDVLRHLHLVPKIDFPAEKFIIRSETLAKTLPNGKLETLLHHAIRRAKHNRAVDECSSPD